MLSCLLAVNCSPESNTTMNSPTIKSVKVQTNESRNAHREAVLLCAKKPLTVTEKDVIWGKNLQYCKRNNILKYDDIETKKLYLLQF